EAAPHLVFQGFLQRVANGHGAIDREYALGKGRCDLYLKWKGPKYEQRIVFELKIHSEHTNLSTLKKEGLIQTAEYADLCNATESHLIIFDRRENIDWKDKVYTETKEDDKNRIKIWGM
ncbi:MAG: PD-(D/E)XK nuclease domain-containing protein, partial [Verrucomicrobiota bacterium]|nr:PD-(D/E)XK nuclease domain-containing protein [Verrucomicrobiota bacterium]